MIVLPTVPGKPEDAQLGDLEASRRRVEAFEWHRQTPVHRRSEATSHPAHDRPSGLQVPATTQDEARYHGNASPPSAAGSHRPV